eukprot:jgi/Mesen1/5582/ME000281S04644
MASVAAIARRAVSSIATKPAIARSFHKSTPAQGGGGYGDMSNRKVKFFFGVFGALSLGIGVPLIAVAHQQHKMAG